jgi:hypothetical protein
MGHPNIACQWAACCVSYIGGIRISSGPRSVPLDPPVRGSDTLNPANDKIFEIIFTDDGFALLLRPQILSLKGVIHSARCLR